ncbi:MAG: hypothetical protein IJ766_04225 [Clostridia bacterium]|nr:hypothetical protein [Clostridia bacterium]
MKQNFFSKEITPRCEHCAKGRLAATGTEVLCRNMGVVAKDYACKKFVYDPLKREPKKLKALEEFSVEDFAL